VWDGRPLADTTVLVRCYHGLGDTIQFARFLPLLPELGCETLVWAQPPLLPLLATLPGVRRLLPLHDGDPGVDYAVDIEIMELAHALRVSADSLPGYVPYFGVPPGPRVSDRLSVGVLAQAGDWDPRRSVPADMLTGLGDAERVALFNLQLEPPLPGMADLSTPDVLLLASRLRSLDLVITPDTMLAHLAGALGVSTWTLLPADADWRWMGPERTDSPWYPTMRLFRQSRPGDWGPVMAEVRRHLAHLVRRPDA
jgi:ADP-heptose:LPS heptosyltransferase